MDAAKLAGSGQQTQQDTDKCPHSHLHVGFLKKIGKAVEKVGKETVEATLTVALSNLGAFSED